MTSPSEIGVTGPLIDRPLAERRARGVGLVLLVGEQPNREWWRRSNARDRETGILLGASARRLCGWAEVVYPHEYVKTCDRVNAVRDPTAPKMDLTAREDRCDQILEVAAGRPIVVLGVVAATMMGVQLCQGRWVGRVLYLPHPSGRSRVWNDDGMSKVAGHLFRQALELGAALAVEPR